MIKKINISYESWVKEKRLVYFYGKATEVIQNKQTEQTETEIIKLNSDAFSKGIDLTAVVHTFKKGLSEATPESRGQLKNAVLSYIQQRLQYAPKTQNEIKTFQESMNKSVASLLQGHAKQPEKSEEEKQKEAAKQQETAALMHQGDRLITNMMILEQYARNVAANPLTLFEISGCLADKTGAGIQKAFDAYASDKQDSNYGRIIEYNNKLGRVFADFSMCESAFRQFEDSAGSAFRELIGRTLVETEIVRQRRTMVETTGRLKEILSRSKDQLTQARNKLQSQSELLRLYPQAKIGELTSTSQDIQNKFKAALQKSLAAETKTKEEQQEEARQRGELEKKKAALEARKTDLEVSAAQERQAEEIKISDKEQELGTTKDKINDTLTGLKAAYGYLLKKRDPQAPKVELQIRELEKQTRDIEAGATDLKTMKNRSVEKFTLAAVQVEEFKAHIISAQQQIETVNKGISGCETALSAMRQQQEEIKGQQSTSKEQYTAQIDSLLTLGVQATDVTLQVQTNVNIAVDATSRQVDEFQAKDFDKHWSALLWRGTVGAVAEGIGLLVSTIAKGIGKAIDWAMTAFENLCGKGGILGAIVGKLSSFPLRVVQGIVEFAGETINGLATMIAKPIDAIKGIGMLIGLGPNDGDFAKAWGGLFKALFAVEDFKEGRIGQGVGKILGLILTTVTGTGAFGAGASAAAKAGGVSAQVLSKLSFSTKILQYAKLIIASPIEFTVAFTEKLVTGFLKASYKVPMKIGEKFYKTVSNLILHPVETFSTLTKFAGDKLTAFRGLLERMVSGDARAAHRVQKAIAEMESAESGVAKASADLTKVEQELSAGLRPGGKLQRMAQAETEANTLATSSKMQAAWRGMSRAEKRGYLRLDKAKNAYTRAQARWEASADIRKIFDGQQNVKEIQTSCNKNKEQCLNTAQSIDAVWPENQIFTSYTEISSKLKGINPTTKRAQALLEEAKQILTKEPGRTSEVRDLLREASRAERYKAAEWEKYANAKSQKVIEQYLNGKNESVPEIKAVKQEARVDLSLPNQNHSAVPQTLRNPLSDSGRRIYTEYEYEESLIPGTTAAETEKVVAPTSSKDVSIVKGYDMESLQLDISALEHQAKGYSYIKELYELGMGKRHGNPRLWERWRGEKVTIKGKTITKLNDNSFLVKDSYTTQKAIKYQTPEQINKQISKLSESSSASSPWALDIDALITKVPEEFLNKIRAAETAKQVELIKQYAHSRISLPQFNYEAMSKGLSIRQNSELEILRSLFKADSMEANLLRDMQNALSGGNKSAFNRASKVLKEYLAVTENSGKIPWYKKGIGDWFKKKHTPVESSSSPRINLLKSEQEMLSNRNEISEAIKEINTELKSLRTQSDTPLQHILNPELPTRIAKAEEKLAKLESDLVGTRYPSREYRLLVDEKITAYSTPETTFAKRQLEFWEKEKERITVPKKNLEEKDLTKLYDTAIEAKKEQITSEINTSNLYKGLNQAKDELLNSSNDFKNLRTELANKDADIAVLLDDTESSLKLKAALDEAVKLDIEKFNLEYGCNRLFNGDGGRYVRIKGKKYHYRGIDTPTKKIKFTTRSGESVSFDSFEAMKNGIQSFGKNNDVQISTLDELVNQEVAISRYKTHGANIKDSYALWYNPRTAQWSISNSRDASIPINNLQELSSKVNNYLEIEKKVITLDEKVKLCRSAYYEAVNNEITKGITFEKAKSNIVNYSETVSETSSGLNSDLRLIIHNNNLTPLQRTMAVMKRLNLSQTGKAAALAGGGLLLLGAFDKLLFAGSHQKKEDLLNEDEKKALKQLTTPEEYRQLTVDESAQAASEAAAATLSAVEETASSGGGETVSSGGGETASSGGGESASSSAGDPASSGVGDTGPTDSGAPASAAAVTTGPANVSAVVPAVGPPPPPDGITDTQLFTFDGRQNQTFFRDFMEKRAQNPSLTVEAYLPQWQEEKRQTQLVDNLRTYQEHSGMNQSDLAAHTMAEKFVQSQRLETEKVWQAYATKKTDVFTETKAQLAALGSNFKPKFAPVDQKVPPLNIRFDNKKGEEPKYFFNH